MRGAGRDERLDVEGVAVALADHAARRVADRVDAGMLRGCQQPLRDAVGILPLRHVQRREHPVELGEHVVGQIERAVAHDVDLAARQQLEAVERLADPLHGLDLAAHVVGLEADAHADPAGVVGDRHVLVPACAHGLDHVEQRVLAVAAPVAVQVQVAAQIRELDEVRQLVPPRELELAVVLAQLRRNDLVAEVAIDLVLVGRAEDLAALGVLDAPLRDAHAAPLGVLAHAHVVALRAGEVLEQVAVALGRHDTQVELHAVVGEHGGLGGAVAEHLGDERLLDEPGGQRRPVARGRDHVHVAHRLRAAAQRAGLVGPLAGGMRAQRLEHRARELERLVEPEHALARRGAGLELGEQLLLLALAEARLAVQAALARGGFELLQRRDVELLPQPARGLGAQARQAHDLDQALGDAAAQLLERRHRAGLAQLGDLRRDRVADVVELGQAAPAPTGSRPIRRSRGSASRPCGRRARGRRRRRRARRDRRAGRTDRRSRHCAGVTRRIVAAAA